MYGGCLISNPNRECSLIKMNQPQRCDPHDSRTPSSSRLVSGISMAGPRVEREESARDARRETEATQRKSGASLSLWMQVIGGRCSNIGSSVFQCIR